MIIGMVIFPNLTQLYLTGPYEVFGRLPSTKVLLIAESLQSVKSDNGLLLTPDETFETAPQVDILFVPGGRGIFEAMQNKKLIDFLQQQSLHAKYITSVCTGSLVLAAAGLLNGYKATTHWLSLHLLKLFDVEVVEERVVIDRNRITGGGVTAGIDFGLFVVSKLFGEDAAKETQLMMEYNPAPPFNAGSPKTAEKEIVDKVIAARKDIQKRKRRTDQKIISVTVEKVIPTLRIFDYKKAIEFYIDWLGFTIVWEHTFDDNAPVYMEVEKDGITLHLSEHHGDGTPGTHVFIWCNGLKEYHKELIDKKYKYNRPGLDEAFYGAWCMIVNDPFDNKISFNEKIPRWEEKKADA